MFRLFPRLPNTVSSTVRSISVLSSVLGASSSSSSSSSSNSMDPTVSVRKYVPRQPDGPFPYSVRDMTPQDAGSDDVFYEPSRFVTHIDDNAIVTLKRYYDAHLPRQGTILDFCSSWISHYPPRIHEAVRQSQTARRGQSVRQGQTQGPTGDADKVTDRRSTTSTSTAEGDRGTVQVLGTGMNAAELAENPVLAAWTVQDLNGDPDVKVPTVTTATAGETNRPTPQLTASTCVVSIDYLTKPVQVLSSIRRQTVPGGKVHLAISNRCFPTKVVGRWLKVDEEERLEMVGDYLHWAGWRDVEIVTLVPQGGGWMNFKDPLWVVRATNPGGPNGESS